MDFSVLPNNNHPDKFLQLDVKSLMKNSAFLQASLVKFPEAAFPATLAVKGRLPTAATIRVPGLEPGVEGGPRFPPPTCHYKKTGLCNPLYTDIRTDDDWAERKKNPSWTVQDYDKHSLHSNLANYLKENPNDLQFWMGDIYTPGYDTLLKKKEREKKHSKCCLIVLLVIFAICILIAIVTVSILFT
uniref:Membrane integral NOTCH2 associated receptor 2 n=1 Tax=Chelydra serpentina TaxID=8475 RepID=A0A8C3SA82_CHESE